MHALSLLAPLPVVGGALRGSLWLPAGGGKVWRVLGGTYEPEQTALFVGTVGPGEVVLDLGAHIGYYTLLASRLVGPAGRVFAFEPRARNVSYLRQHVRLNRRRNVEVVEAAAFDRTGEVRFDVGRGSGTGRVSERGSVAVRAIRVDDFVAERGITPTVVKVDVEGGERPVLEGARETLLRDRPLLFLSTHGPAASESCRRLLEELGYHAEPMAVGGSDLLCVPAGRPAATAVDAGRVGES